MDWLRSEDLKEQKNVNRPAGYYRSPMHSVSAKSGEAYHLGVHRMNSQYFDPDDPHLSIATDIRPRAEPDEDEEEEEDEEEHDDEDDDDGDQGYSE